MPLTELRNFVQTARQTYAPVMICLHLFTNPTREIKAHLPIDPLAIVHLGQKNGKYYQNKVTTISFEFA